MIPIIGAVVSGIFGIASDYMTQRKEKSDARHKRDLAVIQGKQKLAEGAQSHNSAWELEALKRASKFLRWLVSITILLPIWVTMYSPDKGEAIFEVLEKNIPDQWWALFLILCTFVFANKQLIEIVKGLKFWK